MRFLEFVRHHELGNSLVNPVRVTRPPETVKPMRVIHSQIRFFGIIALSDELAMLSSTL
jgi:hypothetical protein